jgi:hypothetical protein
MPKVERCAKSGRTTFGTTKVAYIRKRMKINLG